MKTDLTSRSRRRTFRFPLFAFRFRLSAFRFSCAFTLVEMLVVMLLLSLIVVGLMAMFNQTQKAFRAGLTQTDVLEGGRTVADMLSRELAGIVPSYRTDMTNFFAEIPNNHYFVQRLPGGSVSGRTNVLENLFFLTRENQQWQAYGYCFTNAADGAGTLFRYYDDTNINRDPSPLFANFKKQITVVTNSQNLHRILDGVVELRIRAFDRNGVYLSFLNPNQIAPGAITNANIQILTNALPANGLVGEVQQYIFRSNAVPAYVEFELGVLEKRAYERFRAIEPGSWAAANFLTNQVGRVHVFRQRVPVRMVDPAAYQ